MFRQTKNKVYSDVPLTDQQINAVAPSVFAVEKYHDRSKRYEFVPTITVLDGLREQGFMPFMAFQSFTKIPGKGEFTRHMLRLRPESDIKAAQANEIIITNGHDGSTSVKLDSGVIRFACENGLIVGDDICSFTARHTTENLYDDVIEGAFSIVENFEKVDESREYMQEIQLSVGNQLAFAEAAAYLKFDPAEGEELPIHPRALILPKRDEDRSNDLWTVFNRIQENCIRGGLPYKSKSGRRVRTKPLTSIDSDVKLNKALWVLAERMAETLH